MTAEICPGVAAMTIAVIPFKRTVLFAATELKPLPVSVMSDPGGPLTGSTFVIVGCVIAAPGEINRLYPVVPGQSTASVAATVSSN